MNYYILPSQQINAAYVAVFETVAEAREAAEKLANEFKVDVMVLSLIGTYKSDIKWELS